MGSLSRHGKTRRRVKHDGETRRFGEPGGAFRA
jgi:hypothetical protein